MTDMNVCLFCSKKLPSHEHKVGRKLKFCNSFCKEHYREKRLNEVVTEERCQYCGNRLTLWQVRKGIKNCSKNCYDLSSRSLKGTTRVCAICGKPYEPRRKDQECCSLVCSNKLGGIHKKEVQRTHCTCEMCGTEFYYPGLGGCITPKYCPTCRQTNERAKDRERNRQRRLVKRGQPYIFVNDLDIFKRDDWICQLCGTPIDSRIEWPAPASPSIDHIIPISLGGEHIVENLQAAHLGCNSRKGNRKCQDQHPNLQL